MNTAKNFIRNVSFTSTSGDYELLQDSNIKAFIKERIGVITDKEYQDYLTNVGLNMYFEIYFQTPQRVSINNGYYQTTMDGDLYYSGNFINPLQSIKIENTGVTGLIAFQIA